MANICEGVRSARTRARPEEERSTETRQRANVKRKRSGHGWIDRELDCAMRAEVYSDISESTPRTSSVHQSYEAASETDPDGIDRGSRILPYDAQGLLGLGKHVGELRKLGQRSG